MPGHQTYFAKHRRQSGNLATEARAPYSLLQLYCRDKSGGEGDALLSASTARYDCSGGKLRCSTSGSLSMGGFRCHVGSPANQKENRVIACSGASGLEGFHDHISIMHGKVSDFVLPPRRAIALLRSFCLLCFWFRRATIIILRLIPVVL